jgi:hypothetical protein
MIPVEFYFIKMSTNRLKFYPHLLGLLSIKDEKMKYQYFDLYFGFVEVKKLLSVVSSFFLSEYFYYGVFKIASGGFSDIFFM